jgi:hypothetical protein
MRLSEAMVLGSTLIQFDPGVFYIPSCGRGCLIGFGEAAVYKGKELDLQRKFYLWPWLANPVPGSSDNYCSAIGEMARAIRRGEKTFEEVVDWVRSVEPAEEEMVVEQIEEPEYASVT